MGIILHLVDSPKHLLLLLLLFLNLDSTLFCQVWADVQKDIKSNSPPVQNLGKIPENVMSEAT